MKGLYINNSIFIVNIEYRLATQIYYTINEILTINSDFKYEKEKSYQIVWLPTELSMWLLNKVFPMTKEFNHLNIRRVFKYEV